MEEIAALNAIDRGNTGAKARAGFESVLFVDAASLCSMNVLAHLGIVDAFKDVPRRISSR